MSDILRTQVTVKSGKARVVGVDVEAMERARAQRDATARATASVKPVTADQPPEIIADLDEKLEEILGKEMV
jgi:anti-sigma factor ChrR (cupin superfamily)